MQQTAEPVPATGRPARSQGTRLARGRRLALALIWAAIGLGIVVTGERESSWPDLREAVAAGDVERVELSETVGSGQNGGSRPVTEVRWRDGLVQRWAVAPQGQPARVEEALLDRDADLEVARVEHRDPGGSIAGWTTAGWVAVLTLVGGFALLIVLVASPQPWRATRWGWFWPIALAPYAGIPAYLLLSGPTPGLPEPQDLTRRMSGATGFALGLTLGIAQTLALAAWL